MIKGQSSQLVALTAVAITAAGLVAAPRAVSAHSAGKLDLLGCHEKEAKGKHEYHCHKGPLAGMVFGSKDEAKKALKRKKGK